MLAPCSAISSAINQLHAIRSIKLILGTFPLNRELMKIAAAGALCFATLPHN
jgi:hypothetical protein